GTELGLLLREALLHGGHVDPRTEALLFATDRSHHVASLVRPALERGAVVVTDRYLDSSVAYQGAARSLGHDDVRNLSLWGTYGLLPDLTVVLDLDPTVAAARRAGVAPDRLEREPDTFHADVREAFLQLAAADPSRYLVLDAAQDPDVVHAAIVERVADLLAARGGTAAAGGGVVVGDGADADGTGRNGADADGTGRDGEVAP
ncbi:MAG TPA: dTMP kinase, partial [Actinomycetales bacterium]|nr:dTMP kinase [Actinomycetales bacterium]